MKKMAGVVLAFMLIVPATVWSADEKAYTLDTFEDKLGYSLGLNVGNYVKNIGEEITFEAFLKGLEDVVKGNDLILSAEEIAVVQKKFSEKMQAKQQAELEKMKDGNKKEGTAFLEENSNKKGVIVTESGLQYEVLKKGEGVKPKATDKVKVDYVGKMIDGTEFDSSIKRGQPATFGVNEVIKGWSEALQLMEVGSKYKLVIPSELAYGEQGFPPVIEPNSVLVFEVDLLSIEK